ncbi:MAG: ABC transporter ATP-binding protein [Labilithrix sp.]|nr:ABC transporter ATP-binding protein [Labilithrix sp.]MCW5817304.1 ABC transporter ATP-binding protein [Labilithrix sp.]
MDVLIACKHLSKDYESGAGVVRALREIDLEIAQGEFVAIVGTSGSGKSTLMNILGCLDRPTRGAYELAGFDIGERSSDARAILRNRLIGFIFQGFNLLPRTTALENVELPLVYRGVSVKERRRRALESLDAVGLAERVHHTPNQLSGGQQQRVAIARALVTSPPMLLADEPTGNLDTRTSLEVLALLQKLNRDRGITIVLVTHEHDIAACASRVVTFRDGRIVSDVRDEPVDAATELEKLPPPDTSAAASDDADDPAAAERRRLGGPVPKLLYLAMMAGALLGVWLGGLYESAILDLRSGWIPYAFAFVFEALAAVWWARRSMPRPLTSDQRVRVALTYTLGAAVVLAPLTAFGLMPWSKAVEARLESLSSSGVALAIGVVLLGLATAALARYLVIALVTPLFAPVKRDHEKPA